MRPRSLLFWIAFLTPGVSWSANTFNLECPAQAAVGAVSAPSGWSIGFGQYFPVLSAYMPNSSVMACNYATIFTYSGNLFGTPPSGGSCSANSDHRSFTCTGGTTIQCPTQTVIGYLPPMPTGWTGSGGTGNSAGYGTAINNWTAVNGTVLGCYYSEWAGVLFEPVAAGVTCTVAADGKSFTCTSPFTYNGGPVADILPVLDSPAWNWIAAKIVFTNGDGTAYPYSSWSTSERSRFATLYKNMLSGAPLNIKCPNLATQWDHGPSMYILREQALDMYMAEVAHKLYIEATQKVPWSILAFSDAMLSETLSSTSLFSTLLPNPTSGTDQFPPGFTIGKDFQEPFRTEAESAPSYVCDPDVGYRLMAGISTSKHKRLIGTDREGTLKNLSVWFAENVGHGEVPADPSRVAKLEDRLVAHDPSTGKGIVESQGCHGGSNLFFDIARSVNLPIVPGSMITGDLSTLPITPPASPTGGVFSSFTHGDLVFAWGEPGERVLQHMDDINAMGNRTWAPIDSKGALLSYDQAKQVFHDAVWRKPADLRAMGFQYDGNLSWVIPGTGWGLYERTGGFENRPDFGRLTGTWTSSGSADGGKAYGASYYADQGYALCRWQLYLDQYCTAPVGGSSAWLQAITPQVPGPFHTAAEHQARAAACIKAEGGCAAAKAAADSFYARTWGSDLVVKP